MFGGITACGGVYFYLKYLKYYLFMGVAPPKMGVRKVNILPYTCQMGSIDKHTLGSENGKQGSLLPYV